MRMPAVSTVRNLSRRDVLPAIEPTKPDNLPVLDHGTPRLALNVQEPEQAPAQLVANRQRQIDQATPGLDNTTEATTHPDCPRATNPRSTLSTSPDRPAALQAKELQPALPTAQPSLNGATRSTEPTTASRPPKRGVVSVPPHPVTSRNLNALTSTATLVREVLQVRLDDRAKATIGSLGEQLGYVSRAHADDDPSSSRNHPADDPMADKLHRWHYRAAELLAALAHARDQP